MDEAASTELGPVSRRMPFSFVRPDCVYPSLLWPAPLPRPLYFQSHHYFSHIVLFSYYITKPPQPLFSHFPRCRSQLLHPSDSFTSYLIRLCCSTRPAQHYRALSAHQCIDPLLPTQHLRFDSWWGNGGRSRQDYVCHDTTLDNQLDRRVIKFLASCKISNNTLINLSSIII